MLLPGISDELMSFIGCCIEARYYCLAFLRRAKVSTQQFLTRTQHTTI